MAAFAQHVTLVANTVATVTLTGDFQLVEVINVDGVAAVYFTVDGAAPTVAGDDTLVVPAVADARTRAGAPSPANSTVRLISAGAPKVAVVGVV